MARVAGKLDITELKHSITSLDLSSNLVVDSTGLEIWGECEWKRQKHGPSKHRGFVKVDDDTELILRESITPDRTTDENTTLVKVFGDES